MVENGNTAAMREVLRTLRQRFDNDVMAYQDRYLKFDGWHWHKKAKEAARWRDVFYELREACDAARLGDTPCARDHLQLAAWIEERDRLRDLVQKLAGWIDFISIALFADSGERRRSEVDESRRLIREADNAIVASDNADIREARAAAEDERDRLRDLVRRLVSLVSWRDQNDAGAALLREARAAIGEEDANAGA